jgi:hypothetical protein
VVRAVVVLVLERVFVVGGEVVAATTRVLAGRGRDLDQISVATNQETGPLIIFLFVGKFCFSFRNQTLWNSSVSV